MDALRNALIASAVGLSFGLASPANAAVDAYLIIDGVTQPSTPVSGLDVLSFSWGAVGQGGVFVQAPNPGTGLLFDAGTSAAITTAGTGPQTLGIVETGLTGTGTMSLTSSFTGPLFNPSDTLTRTFTLTPNGGSPIVLGSATGDTTMGMVFTMPASLTGPYSITESIVFTAAKAGDSFSLDDSVTTPVPEPATLGLMALGFAGLGYVRRKRKN